MNRTGKYYGDNYGYVEEDDAEIPKIYAVDDPIKVPENGNKPKDYADFHKL